MNVDSIQSEKIAAGDLRVWLVDLTYTQQAVSAELIPQAIGRIAEFAEMRLDFRHPIRLFKYPEDLCDSLTRFGPPDVIGFSNYIWNHTLSLSFARRIKEAAPAAIVVFGGPNYPLGEQGRSDFLRRHPAIDFYIPHEGETPFAQLLEALVRADGDKTRMNCADIAVHHLDAEGRFSAGASPARLPDPGAAPSPYLSGRLDGFFDGKLLPIIQTVRGCPFTCSYCVEGSPTYSNITRFPPGLVASEIEYIGRKMAEARSRGGRNDLFIADSNFGMYPEDLDTCREIAKAKELRGWPEYINVATGKNRKDIVLEAAGILDGALRLSGSVQSLDPEVLRNIRRSNISVDELMDMALQSARIGANSYCDVIMALPGDSRERHFATLEKVLNAGFNMVVTHQLMLLPGSALGEPEQIEQYGIVVRKRIFPRCHGDYRLWGRRIVSAEIETVCVATNAFSFDDYLACRRMHLFIHIFHNDGLFEALTVFLRRNGLPVFRWLSLLAEQVPSKELADLFDAFEQECRSELWESEEALRAHINAPGVVERYNSGELGRNLLLTYKSLAICGHFEELADMARKGFFRLLADEAAGSEATVDFVRDALAYHAGRVKDIFMDPGKECEAVLNHDIPAFLSGLGASPDAFRYPVPRRFRFALSDAQKDMIDRYLRLFGDTPTGTGRLFSKIPMKKILREARPVSGSAETT